MFSPVAVPKSKWHVSLSGRRRQRRLYSRGPGAAPRCVGVAALPRPSPLDCARSRGHGTRAWGVTRTASASPSDAASFCPEPPCTSAIATAGLAGCRRARRSAAPASGDPGAATFAPDRRRPHPAAPRAAPRQRTAPAVPRMRTSHSRPRSNRPEHPRHQSASRPALQRRPHPPRRQTMNPPLKHAVQVVAKGQG